MENITSIPNLKVNDVINYKGEPIRVFSCYKYVKNYYVEGHNIFDNNHVQIIITIQGSLDSKVALIQPTKLVYRAISYEEEGDSFIVTIEENDNQTRQIHFPIIYQKDSGFKHKYNRVEELKQQIKELIDSFGECQTTVLKALHREEIINAEPLVYGRDASI